MHARDQLDANSTSENVDILDAQLLNVITPALAIAAALLLHLLPGAALQNILLRKADLNAAERFALALGIGIALPPLLLEIVRVLGLRWSAAATVAYLALCALGLVIRRPTHISFLWARARHTALLVLMGLFVLAVAVRVSVVREVPVGLWGDSYHHTLIAQLLVDNGGLFTSWQPYAPLSTFTYHFGFQANAAFLHDITGMPVPQCVVLMGQWLNACSVPMAYLLTARFTRSATAGLWAAVLTGFVNAQPAYFVNWGRYTQLAGQLILPALLVAWAEALNIRRKIRWPWMLTASVLTASLMLTHYIVSIFAGLFVLVLIGVALVRSQNWREAGTVMWVSALTTLASLMLAAPWLLNTLNGYLVQNVSEFVTGAVGAQRITEYSALNWPDPFYLNKAIVALAVLGLLLGIARGLLRKTWHTLIFAAWTGCIVLAIVPNVVGLPGRGVIDVLTGYIALYLTVAPLAGFGLAMLQKWLQRLAHRRFAVPSRWVTLAAVFGMMGLAVWGVTWQSRILDVGNQLVRPADLRAMRWIRANTPADARFLVNTFPAYGGTLIAGKDGGWWIPLLAGRPSTLPPITYGSEQGFAPHYRQQVNDFAAALRGRPLTDGAPVQLNLTTPQALRLLRSAGVTYIYRGAFQSPGPSVDEIDTVVLRGSPDFRLVYKEGGVEIFAMLP